MGRFSVSNTGTGSRKDLAASRYGGEPSNTPGASAKIGGLVLAVVAVVLVLAGGGWYYTIGTPEHSLRLLIRAVREGDRETQQKHFARDELVGNTVEVCWEKIEPLAGGSLIGGLALAIVERPVRHAAEVYVSEEVDRLIDRAAVELRKPGAVAELALPDVEWSGSEALVPLDITLGTRHYPLVLVMAQNPDRTWRICRLSRESIDAIFSVKTIVNLAIDSAMADSGGRTALRSLGGRLGSEASTAAARR